MAPNTASAKRPRLAAVVTSYKKYLHPQHVVDRFLDGYGWNGTYHHPDMDVVSYCFGVPPEQYLAEGIDRSLIRRAMWGMLPESVLTNRLSGLQAADWYEKLESRRNELAKQIAALSQSPLARKVSRSRREPDQDCRRRPDVRGPAGD